VKEKGTLEAMGVQQASAFRHDVQYREGRQFRKTRDRRAVERMTAYGKRLLQDRWTGHEHEILGRLWAAGMTVPYPLAYGEETLDMEYLGTVDAAAPQLFASRLSGPALADAFEQLIDGLRVMVAAGIAHGDLSAYNLLWWEEKLWFIDFPQAVDIAANPQGLNFLHNDVSNVCAWFTRRGHRVDPEEVFADLLLSL